MNPHWEGPSFGVVIPAAGSGRRLGGRKKAYIELRGEPVLLHALRPFLAHPGTVAIVVALPPEDAGRPPAWLTELDERLRIVAGGATRMESVGAALDALTPGVEVVLVHDAARPLVTRQIIDRCVEGMEGGIGAVAGWPAVDTMQEVDARGVVVRTPDRSSLWNAQTPQGFRREALAAAYRRVGEAGRSATDDAAVFMQAGGTVRMVEGSPWNLKVTHPDDVEVAELLLGRSDRGGERRR